MRIPKGTAFLDYFQNFGLRSEIKEQAPAQTPHDFHTVLNRQLLAVDKITLCLKEIERLNQDIEFLQACNVNVTHRMTEALFFLRKRQPFWKRLRFLFTAKP
jgi:hypothetical protein